jgi:hypothetical protein
MRFGVTAMVVAALTAGACSSSNHTDPASGPCPPDDPTTPENESECKALATVKSGSTAVAKRGCQNCHGQDMSGSTSMIGGIPNTPLGETVELYPPNLTPDVATGVAPPKWTDDALALAIRKGVDNTSESLCPQMTHFADMSDFEVYSIVMYLRSLPPVNKKVPRSVCPPLKTKAQQAQAQ